MPVVEHVVGGPDPEEVARDTWGHMDARPGVRYRGTVVFAEGVYGGDGVVALSVDFGNAGDGPWFYEGIQDWLCEQETELGRIYTFRGCYRLRAGGAHEFVGETTERPLTP